MDSSTSKEKYIEILGSFKSLLRKYDRIGYDSPNLQQIRTKINQEKHLVEKIVNKAGVGKRMTITPPPRLGGYSYKNVNPFDIIFDPPHGVNIINILIDTIDEAIGIINSKENFTIEADPKKNIAKPNLPVINKNSVFVVHGHDIEIKEQVARFLEKLGLNPIILHEKANSGLTIIEKFEKYSNVNYAIVLITPDDIGNSIGQTEKLNLRARQNVIFELGYFFGRLGRSNVCALVKGSVEKPSDYDGILYIAHENEGAWKVLVAKELKAAGLEFDSNKIFE
jgi:predicted nucleotide-binding protein